MKKTCRICKKRKKLVKFYPHNRTKDGRRSECRRCTVELNRLRRQSDHGKRKMLEYRLKAEYGITLKQYEAMVEAQGGRCAICHRSPETDAAFTDRRLHVDHDHETGEIRGLLCRFCNTGLGLFKEDEKLLKRARNYLRDGKWVPA